ncbi:MAG: TetR/AcrR family transcriptional regulator [Pseudolabrys sp.]|nr:TetR/AcrR family transcriptional regulator [Pseudolabrys sp.]
MGLRERNKLDKLRRIKTAARTLFVTQGFEDATVRQVADLAQVGLGTVFAYAANKRDLLFLCINDELETMLAASAARVDPAAPFLDNFCAVLRAHYAYFGEERTLSMIVLRELQFFDDGAQARRCRALLDSVVETIGRMIALGQDRGELRTDIEPKAAAAVVFAIVRAELRRWLADGALPIDRGVADLRRSVALLLSGLAKA